MAETLCSKHDPMEEARRWVKLIQPAADHIWVLGLGHGYHIHEALKSWPKAVISVLEPRAELVEAFKTKSEYDQDRLLIETVQDEKDLLQSVSFRLFADRHSVVVGFLPCYGTRAEQFKSFDRCIRGQTAASFQHFSSRYRMDVSRESLTQMKEFHIKEISQAVQGHQSEAAQIVRILRELVR